ncbi:hypothetical protein ID866_8479 [Astraeus odoratus]|nr:hypothetical protein ID866_8479 [Astraeus odoratus]
MVREKHKRKQVQHLEDAEERGVDNADKGNTREEEDCQSHFAVLTHLEEDQQDAQGVFIMMLDTLSTDTYAFQWEL